MPRRRTTVLALIAVAALLPAIASLGCGGEDDIRALYDSFRSAYEAGDYNAMLALLTEKSRENLGSDPEGALRNSLTPEKYGAAFTIPLERLEPSMRFNREAREGDLEAGKLIFTLDNGRRLEIPAIKENGEWRFSWPRE